MQGLHPDVATFAADDAQIVMEQAQEIVAMAAARPHEGRARVIIVDGAEALNANAANCLLKTLEEPSPGNHIVLVTSAPDRLLPHDPLAHAAGPIPRAAPPRRWSRC